MSGGIGRQVQQREREGMQAAAPACSLVLYSEHTIPLAHSLHTTSGWPTAFAANFCILHRCRTQNRDETDLHRLDPKLGLLMGTCHARLIFYELIHSPGHTIRPFCVYIKLDMFFFQLVPFFLRERARAGHR